MARQEVDVMHFQLAVVDPGPVSSGSGFVSAQFCSRGRFSGQELGWFGCIVRQRQTRLQGKKEII